MGWTSANCQSLVKSAKNVLNPPQEQLESDATKVCNLKHFNDYIIIIYTCAVCYSGDVRLVGGENYAVGRVEVCNNNNTWGTVCDVGWSNVDAEAACKSAGFYWGIYIMYIVSQARHMFHKWNTTHTHKKSAKNAPLCMLTDGNIYLWLVRLVCTCTCIYHIVATFYGCAVSEDNCKCNRYFEIHYPHNL